MITENKTENDNLKDDSFRLNCQKGLIEIPIIIISYAFRKMIEKIKTTNNELKKHWEKGVKRWLNW